MHCAHWRFFDDNYWAWYDMCDSLLYSYPITISRLPLSCWSFIAAGGKGLYFMNRMIALGDLMKLSQILRLQYFFWIHIQKVIFPAVLSYTELTEMVSCIIVSPGVRCQIRWWWISNDCIWCVLYMMLYSTQCSQTQTVAKFCKLVV